MISIGLYLTSLVLAQRLTLNAGPPVDGSFFGGRYFGHRYFGARYFN